MDEVLRVNGVCKSFGPNRVLDRVTLSLCPGEIHAIVGENGAGKSTLMNVLGGVHRPDGGTILLDGRLLTFRDPLDAIQHGISTVHQELSLFPNRSIAQNVFSGREPTNRLGFIRWNVLNDNARRLLRRLGTDLDPAMPLGGLGVGAQQLVEIAKALSQRARVLILDEPTSALSEPDADRLFAVLRELRATGVAIVYISHKLAEVLALADEISVLRDGRLVGTLGAAEATEAQLVGMMVGRKLGAPAVRTPRTGAIVFQADGLTRAGRFTDVSFTLAAGEILGFAGLMGAGRTEVARAIFGADPLDRGVMRLDGHVLRIDSPRTAIRRGLAYLTEDRKALGLFLPMSVRSNVIVAGLPRFVTPRGFLRTRDIGAAAAQFMDRLDIRPRDDEVQVNRLSGGNQQKVLLAKWLCARPRVLIADEPTRGVDVAAKARIHRHLIELAQEGTSVLLISSELPEVLALSDRVAVFRNGRIVATLDRETATEEAVMRHAAA
jgi:rhamnose transport system ATP-binding protein